MGVSKRYYEEKIESLCTCDGGCSFEMSDHDLDCAAREYLFENIRCDAIPRETC